ncbi:MAG: 2-C-methyl-D-erythritol 4-phosphate cytidylyltransferase [Bacilli bacterium]|nr:2-C-methyl-D-erythritol 4-phosphate cytidylyltransferase [Bacilli bacterium]
MFSVVIVAAGSAKRTALGYNKIFYRIKGKTLIEHSVQPFLDDPDFKEIVIVLSKEDMQEVRDLFTKSNVKYVIGGATRQKSVFNGLSIINEEYVLIHDSARPNLKPDTLNQIKKSVVERGATIMYSPVKDSVIEYSGEKVNRYPRRDEVGLVQTPQAFSSGAIKKAHSLALKHKHNYTDDASLYMAETNQPVYLIQGYDTNIKATTKTDLALLEEIL